MANETEILTEDELKEALKSLFKRSQTSMEFRRLCLSDPAEAIHRLTGKALPEGFKLKFLEPDSQPAGKTEP
jgi:hypothetical protein